MMSVSRLAVGVGFVVAVGSPGGSTAAQRVEVGVEVGASSILPPSEVEGDAATFLVGGIRATRSGPNGSGFYSSLLLGRALDAATGGDFLSAELGGAWMRPLGGGWSTGLEGRALAFRVEDPFPYEAGALEGSALLRYRNGRARLRVDATAGAGRSRVTLTEVVQRMRHRTEQTEVLEDDLWRWGGSAEFLVGGGVVAAGAAAGAHRSAGGTYRSVGLRLLAVGRGGALELRGDVWHTPFGDETTGGIAFHVPWGGWSARGAVGRPEPDPLLLAEPGRGAGGVVFGRRVLGSGPDPWNEGRPLYRVVDNGARGSMVRFTVRPGSGATSVEVLGDFTLWEGVAMAAEGDTWSVELRVPHGTHHFGFRVDGDWYLPDDAPDTVPDEWGRRNATLVIEGEAGG